MARVGDKPIVPAELPEIVREVRARTPARLLEGRAGAAYRTNTQLELREAHAAARDAVREELDLRSAFRPDFMEHWNPLELRTGVSDKGAYLLRPDLGRRFDDPSRAILQAKVSRPIDLQIVIGDGLSAPAVRAQVPSLLPLIHEGAMLRGWRTGPVLVIHHCRVGILNEIGELVDPKVVVLLIGERPGLATADSLSAYMAYRPRAGQTDADRNLISNIHRRGLGPQEAAERILKLAAQMMKAETSGSTLIEETLTIDSQREDVSGG